MEYSQELREVCDDNLLVKNILTKSGIFWKHGVYDHNVINAIRLNYPYLKFTFQINFKNNFTMLQGSIQSRTTIKNQQEARCEKSVSRLTFLLLVHWIIWI